ncbi:YceI family protein [Ideonella azotifigens]|uniref:YceI family protein n=1 Tax=Ideonella azotifigens TaxID=513160 RepID=A0ABN1K1L8_9BURK
MLAMHIRPHPLLAAFAAASLAAGAHAAPVRYEIDPSHTYPSFEADHLNGLSVWRGKLNSSAGEITLDKEAGTGTVTVRMDAESLDFGLDAMNKAARGDMLFDTAKYPSITYVGKLVKFVNGAPTAVEGELRLHGVARPVALVINSFKCMPHPMFKREVCGADALAVIQRDEFGMAAGKDYGFKMDVTLRIQIEAIQAP